jgi:hypothetical protein
MPSLLNMSPFLNIELSDIVLNNETSAHPFSIIEISNIFFKYGNQRHLSVYNTKISAIFPEV